MLKQQIERLQEEIKELEQSDLPEKIKQTSIQDKQVMLMELNKQLANAMENKAKNIGQADGGGTRANGPGNSAATF
jgi:adenylosuccinate synthase